MINEINLHFDSAVSRITCFLLYLNTRSSAIAERARNHRRSIVRCKMHFDMLNRSKACASIIINVEMLTDETIK